MINRQFDISLLARNAIGFERMIADLHHSARQNDNYPPYNIVNVNDTETLIEVAVAGFAEDDISVTVKDNTLVVNGKKAVIAEDPKVTYAHRGISSRSFERVFTLAEHVEVRSATVTNGILTISLELVVPEDKQPRKINVAFK